MIEIDNGNCNHCMQCVDVCPARIFVQDATKGKKASINVDYHELCIACGHCIAICPENAVLHEQLPTDMFGPLEASTITSEALHNLLLSRRSIRAYKSELVPRTLLQHLVEGAGCAPTASNSQNVGITVVKDAELLSDLEGLVIEILWNQLKKLGNPITRRLARFKYNKAELQGFERYYRSFKRRKEEEQLRGMIFRGAPCAIMTHAPQKNTMNTANCALAIANMTALAQTQGLGTCWMGFLIDAANRTTRINRLLEIPETRKILGCIAVGYPKYSYSKSIPRTAPQVNWL
ncbi:MAG: nitroreductase family protein [Candidatus Heimdallarchaeota archaeon]